MPQTRQLAAIMFTDIVGYTALMGEDEQRAFELLRKNRGLQKPLIERYNGQWIKELGDGVLTSFPNVTDAVLCATEIQRICNEKGDYKLRIGIHLGEVVFEDGDVFGDGVNIASRLQTLAPVGGIWISETVHQNVFNKKEIRTRFVREEVLKNVKEPIRVYEVGTEDAVLPFDSPFPAKKILPVKKPLTNVDNRKPLLLTSAVVLLLAVVGFWLYWIYGGEKTKQIHSIAVMPFVNESRSTDLEYLSDGMTETLIRSLSQLPDLNVKARSSVFHYKGKGKDAQSVGRDLNVQAVLNGRVVQRGNALTLYLELVDAATSNQIWGEEYNRKTADLIALQNEVARDVTGKLRIKLSGAEEQKLAKNYTTNSEAYQLYLKGRYHYNRRTLNDYDKSIEYYQQAIALDPNYALAYAGLADSYVLPKDNALWPELMAKAREAAAKAVQLDDQLAESHTALGLVLYKFEYNFTSAERACRRATELNPNYSNAHYRYGELLALQGRWEEGFAEIRRALELEPLNLSFNSFYGVMLFYARRYDEAIAQLKKTLELDANFPPTHNFLSFVYWIKGDYAKSVEERAKFFELNDDPKKAALVRGSFAKGGWTGFLRVAIRESIVFGSRFTILAINYAALGEKDEAFAALNKAFANRETLLAGIKVDPRLDPLRSDPRFQELVQRMGFK